MRSNYTDLPDYFTLKMYSPIPTTWSMSTMQQPLIALKYTSTLLRNEGLQPKIQSLNPLNEWLVRLSV